MGDTIESIFDEIGGFGLAQWIVVILIFYPFVGASWGMMQMAFAAKVPAWYCVEFKSHGITQDEHHEQGYLYTNQSDVANVCFLNESVCSTYRFTGSEKTTVNEWNLICGNKWIPSFMISIQMGGVLVGAIIAGQNSDRWGRRKSLLLATTWHTCANLAAFFSPNWHIFTACRFLIGFGIGGIYTISFPYAMEFLPLNRRGRVAVFPFWTFGVAIFVGVTYALQHWRYLQLASAAFCLPISPLLFLVPESIRWLTVEGRLDDAMAAIRKMARLNGKPVPPNARSILEMIYSKRRKDGAGQSSYSYLDLFKSLYLVKCLLVMCFLWASMSLISYGISFGVHGLAGNLYVNILLTNCVEIPGLFPVLWLMDRIGRKGASVIMFSVICVTTLVVLVIRISVPGQSEENERAVFWFALITKLCIDNVWNVIQAWISELYPTTTRNLGYGLGMTSARVGGILAPFLINLKEQVVQTYVITLSLSLVAVLLCFLLPETRLLTMKDSMALTTSPGANDDHLSIEMEPSNGHQNGWRAENAVDNGMSVGKEEPAAFSSLLVDARDVDGIKE